MKNPAIIALDFGSQSAKALIFDYQGKLLVTKSAAYPWIQPQDGMVEVSPSAVWEAAQTVVEGCIAKTCDEYEVKAMSFSYFGHGMLLTDKNYEPTTNIILLADNRSKELYPEIVARGSDKVFESVKGSAPNKTGMPMKIYWMKKYRPDVYEKTAHLSDIQQFILAKLGLEVVNDSSMASCKDVMDARTYTWSYEICDAFDIPRSWVGEKIVKADYIAGKVRYFGRVDMKSEVLIMPGGHDTECGVLGMGAIPENPGILSDSMGTYHQCGFLSVHSEANPPSSGFASFRTKCGNYKGNMNSTANGGSTMSWFIRTFCGGVDNYNEMFAAIPFDGTNPTFFCPDFTHSIASIGNMTITRTREQIFEALIEGITFELAGGYDKLRTRMMENQGCAIKEIRAMGGGSQADKFLQLRATVFGIPVVRSTHIQGTGAGAAMLAAVGAGAYKDYKEASDNMVTLTDRFEPDLKLRPIYLEKLARYSEWRAKL